MPLQTLKTLSIHLCVAVALPFGTVSGLLGQSPPSDAEFAIRNVLEAQVKAWNEGDIDSFMGSYVNSSETTFVGDTIYKGYQDVLERYKKQYSTTAKMGKLRFSDVEVRLLGAEHAWTLGRFELDRAPEAGGPVKGIFSLIFGRHGDEWKIMLDHTHQTPK